MGGYSTGNWRVSQPAGLKILNKKNIHAHLNCQNVTATCMTWQMGDSLIYVSGVTPPSPGGCDLLVQVNACYAGNTDIYIYIFFNLKKGCLDAFIRLNLVYLRAREGM